MGFLTETITRIRRDLERSPLPEGSLLLHARSAPPPVPFEAALRVPGLSLIAEVKRASPSAGAIAQVDPAEQAWTYAEGGAAAISVLTEPRHFEGSLADLRLVRRRLPGVPLLRKDFVIHPSQVIQSRAEGADAVLLIAAALTVSELEELRCMAEEMGMSALVEVFSPDDLERTLASGASLVGVNARNLETLEVDRDAALVLAARVPPDRALVIESGIRTRGDARRAELAGATGILVGEALMRASDPAAAIRELLGR